METLHIVALYGIFLTLASTVQGLSFAKYYGSHMVLQEAPSKPAIWGYADPSKIGQKVRVTLTKDGDELPFFTKDVTVTVGKGATGYWRVELPATQASSTSYTFTASLDGNTIQLDDLLFGEIWLCSGQSNMAMQVFKCLNATEEMKGAKEYPNMRIFYVGKSKSASPLEDLTKVSIPWSKPNPANLRGFSSLCWSFGRKLHESHKKPIGLVNSNWGGTPIEKWSSTQALDDCSVLDEEREVSPMASDEESDVSPMASDEEREVSPMASDEESDVSPMASDEESDVSPMASEESHLWNAMIHPLTKMAITGAIWYQGEANTGTIGRSRDYGCMFSAMIRDWRRTFSAGTNGQTQALFPFGFVQLAGVGKNMNQVGNYPYLRWKQTAELGRIPNQQMPNTFIAVAMDLPDFNSPYGSIHPRDKTTLSDRFLLSYKREILGDVMRDNSTPVPTAYRVGQVDSLLEIQIDNGQTPIKLVNKNGFDVCCTESLTDAPCAFGDRRWRKSSVQSITKDKVILDLSQCLKPYIIGHRYAWRQNPCLYKDCGIYTAQDDLPMPPYYKLGLLNDDGRWHKIAFL